MSDSVHPKPTKGDVFWGEIAPYAHIAQFYDTDGGLLDTLARYIGEGLRNGEAAIVIATAPHLAALERKLLESGVGLQAAISQDRYIALMADAALAEFMVNDWPDGKLFIEFIQRLLFRARGEGRRVRAFGEMVAILWQMGHSGATVWLECLWNQLCQDEKFSLLCAYPKPGFTDDPTESLAKICAAHSHVLHS